MSNEQNFLRELNIWKDLLLICNLHDDMFREIISIFTHFLVILTTLSFHEHLTYFLVVFVIFQQSFKKSTTFTRRRVLIKHTSLNDLHEYKTGNMKKEQSCKKINITWTVLECN